MPPFIDIVPREAPPPFEESTVIISTTPVVVEPVTAVVPTIAESVVIEPVTVTIPPLTSIPEPVMKYNEKNNEQIKVESGPVVEQTKIATTTATVLPPKNGVPEVLETKTATTTTAALPPKNGATEVLETKVVSEQSASEKFQTKAIKEEVDSKPPKVVIYPTTVNTIGEEIAIKSMPISETTETVQTVTKYEVPLPQVEIQENGIISQS